MLAIACYANYNTVFAKGSIVNLNIITVKANLAFACALDRFHANKIFADRNCIATINFDAIACSISSIGVCNGSYIAINSNGSSFISCILFNFYPRTLFDCIINTINLNACNCVSRTVYLYLRTGSKGLINCTIRNLNESVTAFSAATAGNSNSTFDRRTCFGIAISQQADSCGICLGSIQSNFFNIVTT